MSFISEYNIDVCACIPRCNSYSPEILAASGIDGKAILELVEDTSFTEFRELIQDTKQRLHLKSAVKKMRQCERVNVRLYI